MRALFVGLSLFLVSPANAANPLRVLVAFGSNQGLSAEVPLRYAETDAKNYADTLVRLGRLDRSEVHLVMGAGPEALEAALSQAAMRIRSHGGESTLFFYFSGHGDEKNLHIAGKRFPLERLDSLLAVIPAQLRVSVIDACRGQGDTREKGFGRAPAFAVDLQAPQGLEGVVTLRSSSPGEASQESNQLGGAVFTHYLTTAMRGAADRDGDNRVTLQEAYAYAYRQTVRRSAVGLGSVMHPSADLDIEGAGELVLTRPEPVDAVIVLPAADGAQFLVFDTRTNTIEAEVWGSSQRAIPVRVHSGDYLVQRRDGPRSGAVTVAVNSGETRTLDDRGFVSLPADLLAAKGGHLRLFFQSVSLGYGGQLTHTGGYGDTMRLRYSVGGIRLAGSIGLDLGRASHVYQGDTRQERWLAGELRLAALRLAGPFDVFGGVSVRGVEQVVKRPTDPLLVGLDLESEKRFVGLGIGGVFGLSWFLPLGPNWGLSMEVSTAALAFEEGQTVTLRPELASECALLSRF